MSRNPNLLNVRLGGKSDLRLHGPRTMSRFHYAGLANVFSQGSIFFFLNLPIKIRMDDRDELANMVNLSLDELFSLNFT